MIRLGLFGDIHWLFARGGMDQFLEIRNHTYRYLTIEFLSALHVQVTSSPCSQEGYISFYLNREFYKFNLSVFNSIFDFSPSMDLPYRHLPKDFNLNVFWNEISRDYRYDMSNSKGTVIRNSYIRVA